MHGALSPDRPHCPAGRLSRRALLLGALGSGTAAVVAGCTGAPPDASSVASPAPTGASGASPSIGGPAPSDSAAPGPSAPDPSRAVDLDAVIARFAEADPVEWGLDVTGVVSELPHHEGFDVALTLDACGGPHGSGVDERLLAVLEAEDIVATLFLNQRWIEANPSRAAELAADPRWLLANHGSAHLPLSVTGRSAYDIPGTVDAAAAVQEVWSNHLVLTELVGRPPTWFRSGTAHYDEVGVAIAAALGERVAGFTVNGDGGATYSATTVAAEVASAGPGGIVIAHMNQPGSGTADGFADAIPRLREIGARFVHLP